jgi:hypothetical protein
VTGLVLDADAIPALAVGSTVYARTAPNHRRRGDHAGHAGGSVGHCVDQIDARLTDHSINAHLRAVLRHVPARPPGRYNETGSAASSHEYVQVA